MMPFPLAAVHFIDDLHGWSVGSSGTLVGYILATRDGGGRWVEQGTGYGPLESVHFTDVLHGEIHGWDGDSPQHRIVLTTTDGGEHWELRRSK